MGLCEVIPSIPRVLKRIGQTVDDIVRLRPRRCHLHRQLEFRQPGTKNCVPPKPAFRKFTMAPQVWAWKRNAPRTMYKYVDHLLTLLPQEPKYSRLTGCRPLCRPSGYRESGWFTAIGKFFFYSVANTVLTPHKKSFACCRDRRHTRSVAAAADIFEAAQMPEATASELFLSFRRLKTGGGTGLKTCFKNNHCRCWWWKAKKIATTQ